MREEAIPANDPRLFEEVLGTQRWTAFARDIEEARRSLDGVTWWHVNSTSQGGGVAELLGSVIGYAAGAGLRTRWVVIDGSDEFFAITKRLHMLLHGQPHDGASNLSVGDKATYEAVLRREAADVLRLVKPGDPVVLHDPQTLGLAPLLRAAGSPVVWVCHVGVDEPNEPSRAAWRWLRPYLRATSAQVFSRHQYAWDGLDLAAVKVIPPCLDAFSPKNQFLSDEDVAAVLATVGVQSADHGSGHPNFVRRDHRLGTVERPGTLFQLAPVPPEAPVVTQVSRWDPLKDHGGVLRAFTQHVPPQLDAHLLLVGPDPDRVADDPDGARTLHELRAEWRRLPEPVGARVHLCCLPMDDADENAAMVNAIQRRSTVVVQKSLAEGFGLTVAEAMWKRRPVIGSRVGGIQDQIVTRKSGVLVDPHDEHGLGNAMTTVLRHRTLRASLAAAARESVLEQYLAPRFLSQHLRLAIGHR